MTATYDNLAIFESPINLIPILRAVKRLKNEFSPYIFHSQMNAVCKKSPCWYRSNWNQYSITPQVLMYKLKIKTGQVRVRFAHRGPYFFLKKILIRTLTILSILLTALLKLFVNNFWYSYKKTLFFSATIIEYKNILV